MNLVDKQVVHGTFGKGNVVSCSSKYIKIGFESGVKKFVFPDVFGEYMTLTDKEAAEEVNKKIAKREEKREALAQKIREEMALKQERQELLDEQKRSKNRKVNPKLQSVFWCKAEEEEEVFADWKVFVGTIKSGARKGEPRRLARMDPKSGCLLTKREPDMAEEDRRILGAFMVEEGFDGRTHEDAYIPAHKEFRIQLTKEESEKMFFWKYYANERFPTRMTWNSGRQRYFDNVWMAQILRDIVSLRKETEQEEETQLFFEHFCRVNRINIEDLPEPNGALVQANADPEDSEDKEITKEEE